MSQMKLLAAIFCTMCLSSSDCFAEPTFYKNWFIDFDSDKMVYAVVINDTGSLIGKYCYSESSTCNIILGMNTSCEADTSYQIFINTDIGASAHKLICGGQSNASNGTYRYIFENTTEIDNVMKNTSKIGLAIPLHNDQFRIIRFSLEGNRDALEALDYLAEKKFNKPSDKKTNNMSTDQIL